MHVNPNFPWPVTHNRDAIPTMTVQCSVDVSSCCIIPMYVEQADTQCSTEYVLMWCIIAMFTSPVIMSILCQP